MYHWMVEHSAAGEKGETWWNKSHSKGLQTAVKTYEKAGPGARAGAWDALHASSSRGSSGCTPLGSFLLCCKKAWSWPRGQAVAQVTAWLLPTSAGMAKRRGGVSRATQREVAQPTQQARKTSQWSCLNGPGPRGTPRQCMVLICCHGYYRENSWLKKDFFTSLSGIWSN